MRTLWIFLVVAAAVAWAGCDSAGTGDDGGWEDAADGGQPDDAGAGDGDEQEDGGADLDGPDGGDGGTIDGRPKSPMFGWIVFNEVLIDGTAEGDPNGDGDTAHPFEDQFVELVNVGAEEIDLEGFAIIEEDLAEGSPRHGFPAGSWLPAGHALVVFGGGDAPAAELRAAPVGPGRRRLAPGRPGGRGGPLLLRIRIGGLRLDGGHGRLAHPLAGSHRGLHPSRPGRRLQRSGLQSRNPPGRKLVLTLKRRAPPASSA
jgi:hypothetical protein